MTDATARYDDLDLASAEDRAIYRQRVDQEYRLMRIDALIDAARAMGDVPRAPTRRDCIRVIANRRIRDITGSLFH